MATRLPDPKDIGPLIFHGDGSVELKGGPRLKGSNLPEQRFGDGSCLIEGDVVTIKLDSGEQIRFEYRDGAWWQELENVIVAEPVSPSGIGPDYPRGVPRVVGASPMPVAAAAWLVSALALYDALWLLARDLKLSESPTGIGVLAAFLALVPASLVAKGGLRFPHFPRSQAAIAYFGLLLLSAQSALNQTSWLLNPNPFIEADTDPTIGPLWAGGALAIVVTGILLTRRPPFLAAFLLYWFTIAGAIRGGVGVAADFGWQPPVEWATFNTLLVVGSLVAGLFPALRISRAPPYEIESKLSFDAGSQLLALVATLGRQAIATGLLVGGGFAAFLYRVGPTGAAEFLVTAGIALSVIFAVSVAWRFSPWWLDDLLMWPREAMKWLWGGASCFALLMGALPLPIFTSGAPYVFGFFGLIAVPTFLARLYNGPFQFPQPSREVFEGPGLTPFDEALSRAQAAIRPKEPFIVFGFVPLPVSVASQHFLVAGTTGSGKTLTIRALLHSAVGAVTAAPRGRIVAYDSKRENLGYLSSMGLDLGKNLISLNPFDGRGWAWDIAADFTDPDDLANLAGILVPQDEEHRQGDSFWNEGPQLVLTAIMQTLQETAGQDWDLRDVMCALHDEKVLRDFLKLLPDNPANHAVLDRMARIENTYTSVRTTLDTRLQFFYPIAAAWHHARKQGKKVSLERFMDMHGAVLLLGHDPKREQFLQAINRVLLDHLVALVRSRNPAPDDYTWFFFDEIRNAGRIDSLPALMTEGRSKRACVVLGFQHLAGMRQVYTPDGAAELAAMCHNQAMFLATDADTARWQADLFTRPVHVSTSTSVSEDHEGNLTVSEQKQLIDAHLVPPDKFQDLEWPERGTYEGFFRNPHSGRYAGRVPTAWFASQFIETRRLPTESDFELRPREERKLQPWNADDRVRVGLSEAKPRKPRATSKPDGGDRSGKTREYTHSHVSDDPRGRADDRPDLGPLADLD